MTDLKIPNEFIEGINALTEVVENNTKTLIKLTDLVTVQQLKIRLLQDRIDVLEKQKVNKWLQ